MSKNVLITGGTGLIGSRLTEHLLKKGYNVSYLSRNKDNGKIKKYRWDIQKKSLEDEAILSADYIINLAGASVFEKKWNKEFKKEILESRTSSVELLSDKLKSTPHHVKAFVSASAIGYYGADTGDTLITETSEGGKDFLAEVVQKWESAMNRIEDLQIRTVKLRIGIVMSKGGGVMEKLINPINKGAGAALASGKQYVSWIHIDDLCNIFIKAIEDENIKGVYNAVAPHPVTNEELTKSLAGILGKSIILPNVPEFVLKFLLGSEKAALVSGGNKVSSEKIQKTGFDFNFPRLNEALENLLK
jgi:uncharacterized protein